MGVLDLLKRPVKTPAWARGTTQVTLMDVANDYEIIEVGDGYALVQPPESSTDLVLPPPKQLAAQEASVSYPEVGYTGPSNWTGFMREEYNPELRESLGMQKYDRMRRNDASVRSALRLM